MSSVTFSGLATGLDTGNIVAQLVELRRAPIYRLEARKQGYQSQISALSTLKSKLLALQEAAQNLDTSNEFSSLVATSGNEDVLGVEAASNAAPGTYTIQVESRAVAQKEVSQGFDNATDSVGSGTLSFTVAGEVYDLELTGVTTLQGLAAQINENVDGVGATIVFDGSATGGYHLVMTGSEAGTANTFTVDASGLSGGVTPAFTNQVAAADAQLIVDGISVTSSSNQPSGVIAGLTLDLLGAAPGEEIVVDVSRDAEGIAENVKSLVDAYNDVKRYMLDKSASGGDLYNNPSARSVTWRIDNIMSSALSGGLSSVTSFHQIGVSRGADNLLEWDEDKFAEALADDYGAVRDLLIERDGNVGKASLLDTAIDDLTDSVDGLFKNSTDILSLKIKYADSSIDRYERSIETYQSTLERKFTAMEAMVSQLQAQGNYLTSIGF